MVRVPCNLVVSKIIFLKIHFEFVDLDGVGEIRWINIYSNTCMCLDGGLTEPSMKIHSLRYAAFVGGRKAVV